MNPPSPEFGDPIIDILKERTTILNYLNQFHDVKYQKELKVIFENSFNIEPSTDYFRTMQSRSDQILKRSYNYTTKDNLINAIQSFSNQIDADHLRFRRNG